MEGTCEKCGEEKNDIFYVDYAGFICVDCAKKQWNHIETRLVAPVLDKGWSLQFRDKSEERHAIAMIRSFVYGYFKQHEKQYWSLQGNSGWCMFDFLSADQDYILNTCIEVTEIAGLKLEIGGQM